MYIVHGNRKPISLVCIYRVFFVSITVFLKEIVQLLEVLVASNDDIVIAGDVNIHLDEDELYSNNFKDILNMFNIRQHVDFPTHKIGHTLDIIATFYDNPAISNISAEEYDISDHFLVDFNLAAVHEIKGHKNIFYRNLIGNTINALRDDISKKLSFSNSHSLVENLTKYDTVLASLLNKHAPLKSKVIKIVPNALWFDFEYGNMRRLRRKAERQHKKTGMDVPKENYKNLRKQTTNLAFEKKRKYYSEKLENSSNSTKSLYSVKVA